MGNCGNCIRLENRYHRRHSVLKLQKRHQNMSLQHGKDSFRKVNVECCVAMSSGFKYSLLELGKRLTGPQKPRKPQDPQALPPQLYRQQTIASKKRFSMEPQEHSFVSCYSWETGFSVFASLVLMQVTIHPDCSVTPIKSGYQGLLRNHFFGLLSVPCLRGTDFGHISLGKVIKCWRVEVHNWLSC